MRSDPAAPIQRRPLSRFCADAIVVLGRNVNADGSLPLIARARVERAVELYRGGIASRLIASGRNRLMAEPPPPVTEAAAMARLARKLGVPSDAILIENPARDTIGNAYFAAREFLEPNGWDAIRVVTSDHHVPRTSWIFQQVLGGGVDVSLEKRIRRTACRRS